MKRIFALLLTAVLSSCGSSSDPAPAASKALFSSWAADDGSEVIDLTGGTFGSGQAFNFVLTSGERCLCTAAFGGTNASATVVLTGCGYVGGGGGDPGCAALNASYTLTNTGTQLTICSGTCDTYH
jgi:hypothetical protein